MTQSISESDPSEAPPNVDGSTEYIRDELAKWQRRFTNQSQLTQRFINGQAGQLADALLQKSMQIRFSLPQQVATDAPVSTTIALPENEREQTIGGVFDRSAQRNAQAALAQRLDDLEQSNQAGIAIAAGLTRYALALHLVRERLPSGRSVKYNTLAGESIPSLPVSEAVTHTRSAITQSTDAIAEGEAAEDDSALQVPFVEAARRFFLPQWVVFDDTTNPERLLVNSTVEAEARIASMQQYLAVLHMASGIAPYMIASEQYQVKRYGMLGQLINQGRLLARHETRVIIDTIKRRTIAGELNRGLSLSLPYFDDNTLEVRLREFQVVPSGLIMFNNAFVVRAARLEAAKAAQDTRLSPSTRKYLLIELAILEQTFDKR